MANKQLIAIELNSTRPGRVARLPHFWPVEKGKVLHDRSFASKHSN
jgi:hypothetical protein